VRLANSLAALAKSDQFRLVQALQPNFLLRQHLLSMLFSESGLITKAHRARMTDQLLKTLVFDSELQLPLLNVAAAACVTYCLNYLQL